MNENSNIERIIFVVVWEKLLFLFIIDCFFVAASIVVVEGVVGKKAQLPCNIYLADNDDVSMVLWYKEGITEPIYR